MINSINVPWQALDLVRRDFMQDNGEWSYPKYRRYMRTVWGIDHSKEFVRIIDSNKYLLFLLKYSQ